MNTIFDADPKQIISAISQELKKNPKIAPPVWVPFVKTGVSKERVPEQLDWWHTRLAAILRTVAIYGPVGTNRLKVKFGSKKRRGHKKKHFYAGSGSIARKGLQQLEAAGYIVSGQVGTKKGRIMTPAGLKFIAKCLKGEK